METNIDNFNAVLKYISTGIGIRPVGSSGLWLTKEYITKKFCDWGYEPKFQDFKFNEHELTNVIASLIPKCEVKNVITFVAHYDSVPVGRGSMDNASGVAVVMELARVFSETCKELEINNTELRFIALSGEEVGCVGSIAYVDSLDENERKKIKAVYNFDMFMARHGEPATLVVNTVGGYNANGEYVDGTDENPFDNIISRNVEKAIIEQGVCEKDTTGEEYWSPRNYGHSDHETFHKAQIESANVTIRGKKSVNGKLPDGYHTKNDIYDAKTFDFAQAEKFLHAVYHSVLGILEEIK